MPEAENILAAAKRLWQETKGEFQDPTKDDLAEQSPLENAGEEMKKVAKWIQHGITKFGASASVADESDKAGLKPIAEDIIKAFTAALGLLLSLKRGAGGVFLSELSTTGSTLSISLEELGKSVGSKDMSIYAGKVLASVKTLERTSTHNRAAIRRRLLSNLSQLRDAHREVQEALSTTEDGADDDFFDDFDTTLEPAERHLVEAVAELANASVEVLKKVSTACVPPREEGAAASPIAALEVVAVHSSTAARAMDDIVVASSGGLDSDEFSKTFEDMSGAVKGLLTSPAASDDTSLQKALDAVKVAFEAAVAAEEDGEK